MLPSAALVGSAAAPDPAPYRPSAASLSPVDQHRWDMYVRHKDTARLSIDRAISDGDAAALESALAHFPSSERGVVLNIANPRNPRLPPVASWDTPRLPLCRAAFAGHDKLVHLMLKKGAIAHLGDIAPGEQDRVPFTPAYYAALGGCATVCTELFAVTCNLAEPLRAFAAHPHPTTARWLRKQGATSAQLESTFTNVMRSLIDEPAEDADVRSGTLEELSTVVKIAGADVNMPLALDDTTFADKKISPLAFATGRGRIDVVQRLLQLGANPDGNATVDGYPYTMTSTTPLLRAVRRQDVGLSRRLLAQQNVHKPTQLYTLVLQEGGTQAAALFATLVEAGVPLQERDVVLQLLTLAGQKKLMAVHMYLLALADMAIHKPSGTAKALTDTRVYDCAKKRVEQLAQHIACDHDPADVDAYFGRGGVNLLGEGAAMRPQRRGLRKVTGFFSKSAQASAAPALPPAEPALALPAPPPQVTAPAPRPQPLPLPAPQAQ